MLSTKFLCTRLRRVRSDLSGGGGVGDDGMRASRGGGDVVIRWHTRGGRRWQRIKTGAATRYDKNRVTYGARHIVVGVYLSVCLGGVLMQMIEPWRRGRERDQCAELSFYYYDRHGHNCKTPRAVTAQPFKRNKSTICVRASVTSRETPPLGAQISRSTDEQTTGSIYT